MAYIDTFNTWRSTGGILRSRAAVACAKYALYLAGAGTAPQKAWAAAVIPGTNAEIEVDAIAWALAFDPLVIGHEADVTDANLQTAVETALNAYRIPAA